jgi:hypothetical protein
MQLKIKTEGVDFVVSRAPEPKNDNDSRQKTNRDTDEPPYVTRAGRDGRHRRGGHQGHHRCRGCLMSAPTITDLGQFAAAYQRTEQPCRRQPEAKHAAFVRWQEAHGAYEVACDNAATAAGSSPKVLPVLPHDA